MERGASLQVRDKDGSLAAPRRGGEPRLVVGGRRGSLMDVQVKSNYKHLVLSHYNPQLITYLASAPTLQEPRPPYSVFSLTPLAVMIKMNFVNSDNYHANSHPPVHPGYLE